MVIATGDARYILSESQDASCFPELSVAPFDHNNPYLLVQPESILAPRIVIGVF